jgi:hypothetical protein
MLQWIGVLFLKRNSPYKERVCEKLDPSAWSSGSYNFFCNSD